MIDDKAFIAKLRSVVGRGYVLTGERSTQRFRKGFRSGEGEVICVVRPGGLLQMWRVLQACVEADKIVIMQAANTGLTEGSTPKGGYERDVVLINTNRMDDIQALNGGEQVLCSPGSTLYGLERLLAPLGRQPHSVIGSSCIGASVIGGVCNNSGGSLVRRGPSYTEMALFARITETGELELVNHLGLSLGDTPEEILGRIERGEVSDEDMRPTNRKGSDTEYQDRVRDVNASTPARYNADKRGLHEVSGCAGKLAVFAVRLDTFPNSKKEQVFYIGTNDPSVLGALRRRILQEFKNLPVSAEYMHRECFEVSRLYGKDTVAMIDMLGTDRLPTFFAIKGTVDAWTNKFRLLRGLTDKTMQLLSWFWPEILPKSLLEYRDKYEHHLILKMDDDGIAEAAALLPEFFKDHDGEYFECTPREGKIAGLHRFAAAGTPVRYLALRPDKAEDVIALDIALRRNETEWFEKLPPELEDKILYKLYYGHLMCHVLHQDYIIKKGVDVKELKNQMLEILDKRGVEYPAEHNVGHVYTAKEDLAEFYKQIDPTNSFNPGLGKMSRRKHYAEEDKA